jgi:hypothetical protein
MIEAQIHVSLEFNSFVEGAPIKRYAALIQNQMIPKENATSPKENKKNF